MQQATLQVGGKNLLDLPAGEWVHFEIVAGIGAQATGTWDLAVTLPGQEPKRFEGLRLPSPDFENLTWLGFSSNASAKTVFYVDNLQLTNQPE